MQIAAVIQLLLVIAAWLGMLGGASRGEMPPAKPDSHTRRDMHGWTVHIDDRLSEKPAAALGSRALQLLSHRLEGVALAVQEDKLTRLKQVPIWLDMTHGELKSPQYHPSAGWLKDHGYSPALAKAIHIPDAAYFAAERFQHEQPWGVMHEMAHAFHDQVLDFDHPPIRAAWEKLTRKKRYQSVLHISGKERPHYALTDQKEFFAEFTEAYFGMNDFYPFNAGELRREEPEIFALLAEIWGPLP